MNLKRSFSFFFLFLSVLMFVEAQTRLTDSLSVVIESMPSDTARVNAMLVLANEYFWAGKYDMAHETALKTKSFAEKLLYRKGIGLALIVSGQSHLRMGNYNEAEDSFRKAVQSFEDLSFTREKASAHLYLGQVYDYKASYDEALRQFAIAQDLATRAGDQIAVAKTLNSIGITQSNRGNFEGALENYLAALSTTDLTGSEKVQATILNNIGAVNMELSQYDDALKYFTLYVRTMKKLKGTHGLGVGYLNMGEAYKKLRIFDKAIPYLDSASQIQSATGDKKGLVLSYSNLGDVYKALQNWKQSKAFYADAIDIARQIRNTEVLVNALTGISDLHVKTGAFREGEATLSEARGLAQDIGSKAWLERTFLISSQLDSARGDYRNAYQWFKKYSGLSDSLFNQAKSRQIFQMQERYESERKDKEIRLLSERTKLAALQEASTKKIYTIYLVFLSLIILIGTYWLFHKTRHSRILKAQKEELVKAHESLTTLLEKVENQNHVLEQKNESLSELHREKDALIGIVAHDLRSPLNRISGLTQLIEMSGDVNNEQKFILDNINHVCDDGNRLIADLLEINEYESTEEVLKTTFAIGPLVHAQVTHFQNQAMSKQIQLEFQSSVGEETMVSCSPDYLKRILDNLLSNALKFSPPRKSVWVTLDHTLNHDKIVIKVKDQGPGFTEEDKSQLFKKFRKLSARPTGGESSTGLGLSIVKVLTEKIGASIQVITQEGAGAVFIIELPAATVEILQ